MPTYTLDWQRGPLAIEIPDRNVQTFIEAPALPTLGTPIELSFQTVRKALRFLGQPDAANLDEALRNWNPALISRRRALALRP